jgi:uncharacterized protein (TIGR03067 family)
MMRFAVAGTVLVVAIAAVVAADEKALKELEGKYTVTHMEKGGKTAEKAIVDSVKIAISGDEIAITLDSKDDKQERKAKITVDSSVTPHTIDIKPTEGDAKGKTFPGIYKTEKGIVTLAFTEDGERPKEFTSEGKVMLLKMKKVK